LEMPLLPCTPRKRSLERWGRRALPGGYRPPEAMIPLGRAYAQERD